MISGNSEGVGEEERRREGEREGGTQAVDCIHGVRVVLDTEVLLYTVRE